MFICITVLELLTDGMMTPCAILGRVYCLELIPHSIATLRSYATSSRYVTVAGYLLLWSSCARIYIVSRIVSRFR